VTNFIGAQERKEHAYMSYHEDGLLDLLLGLAVLLGGLYIFVDLDIPLGGVWVVLWLPIWLSARKTITSRRLPNVEVPHEQYTGLMRAAVFVVLTLVLLVFAGSVLLLGHSSGLVPSWFVTGLREHFTLVLGLAGAFVMTVAGWLSKLNRLYAYALLTAVAFAGTYLLQAPAGLAVAVVGGVVMIWGLVMLSRFVRSHPVQSA
jgi:hypothetical protein